MRSHVRSFAQYLALGDSMSIDLYPERDAEVRFPGRSFTGLGAASLLHHNHDEAWPDFKGSDLSRLGSSEAPDFRCLASDGADTRVVLAEQIPALPPDQNGRTLVTLTAGGNDLLRNLLFEETEDWDTVVAETGANLRRIVAAVKSRYRDLELILTTVFDPTDGTGDLGDGVDRSPLLRWLERCNEGLRQLAATEGCRLADAHARFWSHGMRCPRPERRWYWAEFIIEPSARGGSELRRLWLETLGVSTPGSK